MRYAIRRAGLAFALLLLGLCQAVLAQGTVQTVMVRGASLEGNLAGDDPVRKVHIYLPPGYADSGKRYPVIYFLHGFGANPDTYMESRLNLPGAADSLSAAGGQEMIIVLPDAITIYNGSMFGSSPTTGDWESFIASDLVNYMDTNYRTVASRAGRGLAGHSMGGYGTFRIGMKYPQVFQAIYAMSACCLLSQPPSQEAVEREIARMKDPDFLNGSGFANVAQSLAAAFASNPQNPPFYFDWTFRDGEPQPLVQAKYAANSPLVFVDQYVTALKSFSGIMMEVGDKDSLLGSNTQMDAELTRLGVAHGWEIYDGDHSSKVGQRFSEKVLPFFSAQLKQ